MDAYMSIYERNPRKTHPPSLSNEIIIYGPRTAGSASPPSSSCSMSPIVRRARA